MSQHQDIRNLDNRRQHLGLFPPGLCGCLDYLLQRDLDRQLAKQVLVLMADPDRRGGNIVIGGK